MFYINFIFLIIYAIGFLYVNIGILVEQYYSLNRFFKVKKTIRNKIALSCGLFVILSVICYFFKNSNVGCFLMIVTNGLFLTNIPLNKYHFTRRNILLFAVSLLISLIMLNFVYFQINKFLAVFFSPLVLLFNLLLSYLILLPLEVNIKNYYISKARNKIQKNNYIIIGITGSFGKTTMKNILYSLLKNKYKIAQQNHNYNTLMGVTKYINNEVSEDDEIIIVEIGIDKINSMQKFQKLFSLDFAIITSIGEMHLSTFKTIENIANEKIKIENLLKEDGKLFVNDSINKEYISKIKKKYILYSNDELKFKDDIFYQVKFNKKYLNTCLVNKFQLDYLMCAIKICEKLKLRKVEIEYGITHIQLPSRRINIKKERNITIIDDSYNANYQGFLSDLELLNKINGYKVVVTGGLIELGEKYYLYNYEIGCKLVDFDLTIFISLEKNHPLIQGYYSKTNKKIVQVDNLEKAKKIIGQLNEKSIVLLTAKGSDIVLH